MYSVGVRAFLPLLLLALSAFSTPKERLDWAEDQVRALLRDPDSAKFKGVKETGHYSFCGWVNAKNAFGGYAGYQPFYYDSEKAVILSEDDLSSMAEHPELESAEIQQVAPCMN